MKYEIPEVTALATAIDAIQGLKVDNAIDSPQDNESVAAYQDWED